MSEEIAMFFLALYFEGDQTEPQLEPEISKYQIRETLAGTPKLRKLDVFH